MISARLLCNELFLLLEEKILHGNIYSGMSQIPNYKLNAIDCAWLSSVMYHVCPLYYFQTCFGQGVGHGALYFCLLFVLLFVCFPSSGNFRSWRQLIQQLLCHYSRARETESAVQVRDTESPVV